MILGLMIFHLHLWLLFLLGPALPAPTTREFARKTPVQSITYKVGSGCPPSVSGLPPGLSYSFDGLTLTISGTPITPGTYNYVVSTTGCIVPITASGTISVKNPEIRPARSALIGIFPLMVLRNYSNNQHQC